MIASKVSESALREAAREVGVEVDLKALSASGRRWRVKVYPVVPAELRTKSGYRRKGEAGDAKYQRESAGYGSAGRRVHAVCWHGFRDFFRAVYARESEAIFRTSAATYRGAAHFEEVFPATGYKNIGSQIAPVCYAEACRCPERGYAA